MTDEEIISAFHLMSVAVTYEGPFGKSYGYWIPIPEKPEWVIHFGVGSTFEYEQAKFSRA